MKSGSICIMDTGITHRGGKPTKTSRWSIFLIFTLHGLLNPTLIIKNY